jgi:hypothetical protein
VVVLLSTTKGIALLAASLAADVVVPPAGAEDAWVAGADDEVLAGVRDADVVGLLAVDDALSVVWLVGLCNATIATTRTTTPRIARTIPAICSRRRRRAR